MSASSTPTTNPLLNISAISLFTEDVAASKAFYTKAFGATPLRRRRVVLHDLVKPSQAAPRDVGKRFQLTVWVDDLESAMAKLKENDVTFLNGPETKPWGMRVVTFEDPAGHSWEIAQKV
ncbi:hypothetical protein PT974_06439 [Cladobotryum mycophilum]|uniref:VOC domain-containing protein n=1 Tax=Cladobotryum mycophilum TaxID=491253 RepID=A0ABR0SLF8_9HYPO